MYNPLPITGAYTILYYDIINILKDNLYIILTSNLVKT